MPFRKGVGAKNQIPHDHHRCCTVVWKKEHRQIDGHFQKAFIRSRQHSPLSYKKLMMGNDSLLGSYQRRNIERKLKWHIYFGCCCSQHLRVLKFRSLRNEREEVMPCADFFLRDITRCSPKLCFKRKTLSFRALVFISPLISRGVEFHDFLIEKKTCELVSAFPLASDFLCNSYFVPMTQFSAVKSKVH